MATTCFLLLPRRSLLVREKESNSYFSFLNSETLELLAHSHDDERGRRAERMHLRGGQPELEGQNDEKKYKQLALSCVLLKKEEKTTPSCPPVLLFHFNGALLLLLLLLPARRPTLQPLGLECSANANK